MFILVKSERSDGAKRVSIREVDLVSGMVKQSCDCLQFGSVDDDDTNY